MGNGVVGCYIEQVCRSTRVDKYKDGLVTNVNDARWRGTEGKAGWRGGVEGCLFEVENKRIGRVLLRSISYVLDKTRLGSGTTNFGKMSFFSTGTTCFFVDRVGNSIRELSAAVSTERLSGGFVVCRKVEAGRADPGGHGYGLLREGRALTL